MTDTPTPTTTPPIEAWVILELFGHVRLAGRVTEEQHFGVTLGRLEIPTKDGGYVTRWFGGSAVYSLTPVAEEIARRVALHNEPEVVHRWELPAPRGTTDARATYEAQYGESDRDLDDDPDADDGDDEGIDVGYGHHSRY